MKTSMLTAVMALAFVALLPAQEDQDPPKPTPEQAAEAVRAMRKAFTDAGLEVDFENRTITLQSVIGRPDQPLEFLLIHRRGKAHEAALVTATPASILNAAMLALGWEKGQNARLVKRDPLPTQEEYENGAPLYDIIAPEGMQVWFTARWTICDDDGKEVVVEVPIEELILDLVTEATVRDATWIYIGGQMGPLYRGEEDVFLADYVGNYVSIVYREVPNHLVTMKHERATDEMIWIPSDRTPPVGTEVALTIHREKPALCIARDAERAVKKSEPTTAEPIREATDGGARKR